MRDVWSIAARWIGDGRECALATLAELRNAKTAPLGTTLAVRTDGAIAGNIGAGCYESEIVEAALATATDGVTRTLEIDLDNDDPLLGGTACGAAMRIVIWRPDRSLIPLAREIEAGARTVEMAIPGFAWTIERKPELLLIGATDLARELCAIARRADFIVRVIDPRPAFATVERVPDAHEIVHAWPDEFLPAALTANAALIVLSHDPKLDLPALECGLRSPAWYIGLLGSRRAQAARAAALRELGLSPKEVALVRGPVGLDLGGTTAAETAVSILAELIAVRSGRSAVPLRALAGAIH